MKFNKFILKILREILEEFVVFRKGNKYLGFLNKQLRIGKNK